MTMTTTKMTVAVQSNQDRPQATIQCLRIYNKALRAGAHLTVTMKRIAPRSIDECTAGRCQGGQAQSHAHACCSRAL